jgi:Uma2 family endonuclease
MATVLTTVFPTEWTLADMLTHLGGIPPERIRVSPPPGTATETDVLQSKSRFNRICELIDGVLVEKTVGYYESLVAATIIRLLGRFLETHDLGIVLGEAGPLRILPTQVRVPDVSFISWDKFPDRRLPDRPVPRLAPDLAIEVLSPSNTEAEMWRKLHDYFAAGVRLVWYIDPRARSARAYTAADDCIELGAQDSLSGGEVLPGFELPLKELFANAPTGPNPGPGSSGSST